MFRKAADQLLDLVYPTRCVFCRQPMPPGRPGLCPSCGASLPRPEDGGRRKGDFFTLCVSPLFYEGAVQEAILRYKFYGAQAYDRVFGELLAECVYEYLEGKYQLLSWVPLDSRRRRQRGYDQAELLAREVGRRLCRQPVPVLKKRKGIQPQSRTGEPEKRRANIAGAYRVPRPDVIEGKSILLIDDIVTTGATLSECAKTLLRAGAEEVFCAALASTR